MDREKRCWHQPASSDDYGGHSEEFGGKFALDVVAGGTSVSHESVGVNVALLM